VEHSNYQKTIPELLIQLIEGKQPEKIKTKPALKATRPPPQIDSFELKELLGQGNFGQVGLLVFKVNLQGLEKYIRGS
jgi:hypothetical protein